MKVLVTGAAGSIGRALCRQLLAEGYEVVALDNDGTDLAILRQDLNVEFFLGDVTCEDDLEKVFRQHSFDGVFHAAALKQVPLCEEYPSKAFETNFEGTRNVLQQKDEGQVFVNISTDKAANPVNTMGFTKKLAEDEVKKYCNACSVRFGNVLRSSGSVIPLFEKQRDNGKDLTVTDPSMTRFFMEKEEAVQLLIHAFENCGEAELFIPEMDSFRIGDLAEVIGNGFEVVGAREGEKKHEDLLTREEASRAERRNGYVYVDDFEGLDNFPRVSINSVISKERIFDIL